MPARFAFRVPARFAFRVPARLAFRVPASLVALCVCLAACGRCAPSAPTAAPAPPLTPEQRLQRDFESMGYRDVVVGRDASGETEVAMSNAQGVACKTTLANGGDAHRASVRCAVPPDTTPSAPSRARIATEAERCERGEGDELVCGLAAADLEQEGPQQDLPRALRVAASACDTRSPGTIACSEAVGLTATAPYGRAAALADPDKARLFLSRWCGAGDVHACDALLDTAWHGAGAVDAATRRRAAAVKCDRSPANDVCRARLTVTQRVQAAFELTGASDVQFTLKAPGDWNFTATSHGWLCHGSVSVAEDGRHTNVSTSWRQCGDAQCGGEPSTPVPPPPG